MKPESGSPPRGRGKDAELIELVEVDGITPAWAGKSLASNRAVRGYKDHPRVGGEKHIANFNDENGQGSPPRGRGKEVDTFRFSCRYGITPAWAGKRRCRKNH